MSSAQVPLQLLIVTGIVTNYFALVRIRRYPVDAYSQLGLNRGNQKALHILGIFLPGVGAGAGLYWLLVTKPRLEALDRPATSTSVSPSARSRGFSRSTLLQDSREEEAQLSTRMESSTSHQDQSPLAETVPRSVLEYNVAVERREEFKFKPSGVVSYEALSQALRNSIEQFRVSPETITGLALASLLKRDDPSIRFHGVELCEYFLIGAVVGRSIFLGDAAGVDLLDLGESSDVADYFVAAKEDAEFFYEVSDDALQNLLASLPNSVQQVLEESLLEEEEPSFNEAAVLTKMFASGVIFLGFQAGDLK